ncbi:hypothetical protein [Pseudomonas syringae]|uniref:hypothetical protein n=3 Tax=Pseudomonas syringae TaxID=317 RepID=UPI001F194279|nr:hypothetical protein [Pseudomonas syringae]MCF5467146.1 hypothetical protein [Pseudomonas syringae]MCF5472219.1 hypothetical protein [Pseudomonas syringae]MCF5481803.1 hypothetical protein [Pseudomonas syringae]MCF5493387.1 hypothetical protein [Pseudomonas syringae]MCF5495997.1 hypothetical protein [Pseudomonas syringae]
MHLVTLSSEARSHLIVQLDNSQQRRAGFVCAYPLNDTYDQVMDVAQLMVIPGSSEWHVWMTMAGRTTTVAIPCSSATPERITQVMEDHVNSDVEKSPGPDVILHAQCDLEWTIRIAIVMKHGSYLIPSAELADLYLVIEGALQGYKRPNFRFVLSGVSLTLPMHLPRSSDLAFQLLIGCTREFISNYKS